MKKQKIETDKKYDERIMLLNRHAMLISFLGTKNENELTQINIEKLEEKFFNNYGYKITEDTDYKREADKWKI